MHIRAIMITAALFGVLSSGLVRADDDDYRHGHHRHHQHDYARAEVVYAPVIYVEPLYQIVRRTRPSRECWSTTESYADGRGGDSAAGLVLGGVLGGMLGNNIAHGHDRDVAVIAGTLLGATIGHDLDHGRAAAPVTRTRCEEYSDDDTHQQIIGYRVQYRYSGRIYETQTERPPGAHVRITVSIDD